MWLAAPELIRIRFLSMLAHRVNYYSGILVYTLNIGVYYFIWLGIYGDAGQLGGMTLTQMTTYLAVSWLSRAFYFNNLDREIAQEVREGSVAIQLIRPLHYLGAKMIASLGEAAFRFVFYAVPGFALAYVLFPVQLPSGAAPWLQYMLFICFGMVVNAQINVITGLLTFFVLNNTGLISAKRVFIDLFSGLFLPLTFYPDWAQAVLRWLPFQGLNYLPSLALSGGFAWPQVWPALGVQLAWIGMLALLMRLLWRQATRRLVVQGG